MDERALDEGKQSQDPTADVERRLRSLLEQQDCGVLCTQGDGQPYGSVVAYALSADLGHLWFATPKTTRKFALMVGCPKVALVVYRTHAAGIMEGAATTVTAEAVVLDEGEREDAVVRLVARQPHLETFYRAPTTAVIRLDVVRCLYVERFQEVTEWCPTPFDEELEQAVSESV